MKVARRKPARSRLAVWVILILISSREAREVRGALAEGSEPVMVRLVHPERQAAEVLRLFEGARVDSPAAALAAWKKANGKLGWLGKPVEAVIAIFNPEMVPEWRIFDGAELRLDLDPVSGSPRWFAIVPHDDGTLAAAITASRLTNPDDVPLGSPGREVAVARLGRSGGPLACHVGPRVVVGSSRAGILCGVHAVSAEPPRAIDPSGRPIESGLIFGLDPERVRMPREASIGLRRGVEILRGWDCRHAEGTLALQDGRLTLEILTTFRGEGPPRPDGIKPPAVERAWLARFPSTDAIATISLAIEPDPSSWDRAFGLADRVERVDPSRANLAPLRTRFNLLAAAAGVPFEADLQPHLRGLSACLWGDARQPGRVLAAVLVLHLDQPSSAARLAGKLSPRLAALMARTAKAKASPPDRPRRDDPAEKPRRLGTVLGRPVFVWQDGRDLTIAWGDEDRIAPLSGNVEVPDSLAAVCDGWAGWGRGTPQRLAALWPGRIWRSRHGPQPAPATLRVLTGDPPVVWWGWSDRHRGFDILQWPDLAGRVRQLLETLALDAPRKP